MKHSSGIPISLVLGLLMFLHSLSLVETMGLLPEEEEDGHDVATIILFMRRNQYKMIFSDSLLKEFYDCLCSPDAIRCSFIFRPGENTGEFVVTEVKARTLSHFSMLTRGDTMACGTTLLSNTFDCYKRKLHSTTCETPNNSGFHKLSSFGSSCRACVNLCWKDFRVEYNSTGTSVRALPEKGTCKPQKLNREPSLSIRETETSTDAKGGFTIPVSQPSSISEFTATSDEADPFETPTNASSPANVSSNDADLAEAVTGKSLWTLEDILYVPVWIGLGCALAVTTIVAGALVLSRRRQGRKQKGRTGSESRRQIYVQPFGYSERESSAYPLQSEITQSTSDLTSNVFLVGGKEYVSYSSPGGVYCTIADVGETSTSFSNGSTAGNTDNNEHRETTGLNSNTRNPQRKSFPQNPGEARRSSCISKLSSSRNMRSAADVPKNMLTVYNRSAGRAVRPGSGVAGSSSSNSHVYSRLNSRGEIPECVAMTVPELYNVAGGDFKPALSKQRGREIGDLAASKDASDHGYALAKSISCGTLLQSNTASCNDSCVRFGKTGDGTSSSHKDGQLGPSEQPSMDYFTLENVDHGAYATVGSGGGGGGVGGEGEGGGGGGIGDTAPIYSECVKKTKKKQAGDAVLDDRIVERVNTSVAEIKIVSGNSRKQAEGELALDSGLETLCGAVADSGLSSDGESADLATETESDQSDQKHAQEYFELEGDAAGEGSGCSVTDRDASGGGHEKECSHIYQDIR